MSLGEGLIVEVRDPNLVARGLQLAPEDVTALSLVPRWCALGAWSLALPASSPFADLLRRPGWGLVATDAAGDVFSGPMQKASLTRSADDPEGTWELAGYDDNVILSDERAFPSPAVYAVADGEQVGSDGAGNDVRTGPAESVILGYVNANVGPAAPVERRRQLLDIAPDLARGATVTGSGRFQQLGELLTPLATTGGVGFRVRQNGRRLLFEVVQPHDRTAFARLDIDNGNVDSLTYSYEAPAATDALVGGDGQDDFRILRHVTTDEATAGRGDWGRTIRTFVDQSSANPDELDQAGVDALTPSGATGGTVVSVNVTASQLPAGATLGDRITVVVGGLEVAAQVTETPIAWGPDGLVRSATIGDPTAAIRDPLIRALRDTRAQVARLRRLERR